MAENQSVKPETLPPSVTEPLKSKEETKKTPLPPEQKNEVAKTSKIDLAQLKKDIEAGRITSDMIKDVLENLGEIEGYKKAYVLSFVIAGLEKKGISVDSGYQKFTLSASKLASGNVAGIATETETKELEILLNEYVNKTFQQKDIIQALMMRTPDLLTYSQDTKEKNVNTYVNTLLKKYQIGFKNIDGTLTTLDTTTIQTLDEKNLNEFLMPQIKNSVTDVKERAFIVTYIQDEKYNKGKNSAGIFQKYDSLLTEEQKVMQAEINKLTPQQQQALGGNNTIQQRFQNLATNPAATLHDMNVNYKNGDAVAAVVFGILGAFLGGKKFGFWGGFVGLVAGLLGGSSIGGENLNNLFKDGANKSLDTIKKISGKSKVILAQHENTIKNNTPENTSQEKKDQLKKILTNTDFLASDAKNIDIFTTEKDFTQQQLFFKKFGLELTQDNQEYIKTNFIAIKKERINNVGDYQSGETVEDYLTKKPSTKQPSGEENKDTPSQSKQTPISSTNIKPAPTPKAISKGPQIESHTNVDGTKTQIEKKGNVAREITFLGNGEKIIKHYVSGKLLYTYEGTHDASGRFNGICRYNNSTKVDVFKDGEKVDYTVEYGVLIATLVANDVAAFTGVWTIPGMAIGGGYALYDTFADHDAGWTLLKEARLVHKDYSTGDEKGYIDRIIAAIGIVPGVMAIKNGAKATKFLSEVEKANPGKAKMIQEKIFSTLKNKTLFTANKATESKHIKSLFDLELSRLNNGEKIKLGEVQVERFIHKHYPDHVKVLEGGKETIMERSEFMSQRFDEQLIGVYKENNLGKRSPESIIKHAHEVLLTGSHNIAGHTIVKDGPGLLITKVENGKTIKLSPEEANTFFQEHMFEIMKKFGVATKAPNKLTQFANKLLTESEKLGKKIDPRDTEFVKRTAFRRFIFGELAKPIVNLHQVIETLIGHQVWGDKFKDMMRIVIAGDKSKFQKIFWQEGGSISSNLKDSKRIGAVGATVAGIEGFQYVYSDEELEFGSMLYDTLRYNVLGVIPAGALDFKKSNSEE